MKPLDCEKCLGFWVCIVYCIIFKIELYLFLPFGFASMVITHLIGKKL